MYTYKGKTTYIVDGDTFDIDVDLGFGITVNWRFRIKDFDSPESWRPRNAAEKAHGLEAKAYATQLIEGKELTVVSYKLAAYGRFECDLILPDGRDFKEVMIAAGMAKRDSYPDVTPKILKSVE